MKVSLVISIFLNLVLVGALAGFLANQHHEKVSISPAAQPETALAVPPVPVVTSQFHWGQLESTNDYQTYIANLRAIGCPEHTIRAIVSADAEAAFALKRQQLELTGNTTARFSPERAKEVAAGLVSEPTAAVKTSISAPAQEPDAQMSSAPASAFSSQQSPMAGVRVATQNTATLASYPVTLQDPVSNDSALNNSQKAAVRQIQQQFENAIGGPNQDPADPAYAARWQTAQTEADDALRAALGSQAYQGYQLQHYFSNFQKVMLSAGEGTVTIDPTALAK